MLGGFIDIDINKVINGKVLTEDQGNRYNHVYNKNTENIGTKGAALKKFNNIICNTACVPIKRYFNETKYHIDWDRFNNIPIWIYNIETKEYYKFYVSYYNTVDNNVFVNVNYKKKNYTVKYEALKRGFISKIVSNSHNYKYDIGHIENNWKVIGHIRNNTNRKRYVLLDMNSKFNRTVEIDENKLMSRGFPEHKQTLKELGYSSKQVVRNKDLLNFSKSDKNIKCYCQKCKEIFQSTPYNITHSGVIMCEYCSPFVSKPEKIVQTTLDYNNVLYEKEKYIEQIRRRVDFMIYINNEKYIIEVNGAHHYDKKHKWYIEANYSDKLKAQYAKENKINIRFIDCKKSDVDYILKSIKEIRLPFVSADNTDIKKILKEKEIIS